MGKKKSLTVELDEETIGHLATLGEPIEVLAQLAYSAAEGVRMPGRERREQTDESLRTERGKTDVAIAKERKRLDEVADDVVQVARKRADELVRSARQKADTQPQSKGTEVRSERTRARADGLVEKERSDAD